MSNSPIPPIGLTPPAPGSSPGQVVQIVSLPDSLQNAARALRVEGEVVQQNRDGSTRIKTPEGNVDVNVRGRQPQPGQKVELEIAAGNPPKTATLRPAPQAPVQTPQPPLPQVPTTPTTNIPLPQTPVTRPAPSTPAPQPVPIDSSGKPLPPLPTSYPAPSKPVAQPSNPAQLPQLTSGQIVRLTPVLLAQITSLQSISTPDAIIPSQITNTNFQAGLIARSAQDNLQKTLIQTLKPGVTPLPNIQPPGTTQAQTPQAQPTTQQTIAKILGAIFSPQPAAANIKIAATMPLMPSLTGSVSLENSITPSMPSARPLMFDARILEIKLPQVQLMNAASNATGATQTTMNNSLSASIKIPMDVLSGGAKPTGIVATVTGFTPQNLPLISIQWPNTTTPQNYILQFASGNLEPGSQITLLPQPSTGTAPANPAGLRPLMALLQPSMLWPAMDETFQTLMQLSPQLAQSLGKAILSPANAAQLGPAALLFIAAARAGDLQNWLGDKRIESLQKAGRQSLIARLSGELSSLTTQSDASGAEWRSYPLPLLWQNEISKVMLHIHHDRGANQQDEGQGGTRFIFDLQLTRMGDVQIDGLLRDKRLDLIIRTQVPISQSMQQAMRLACTDALNGTEIYGELSFQGDLKNWMQVVKREEMFGANA